MSSTSHDFSFLLPSDKPCSLPGVGQCCDAAHELAVVGGVGGAVTYQVVKGWMGKSSY